MAGRLLKAAGIVAAAGLAFTAAGCSAGGDADGGKPVINIWHRPGSLGEDVQAAAQEAFPDYTLKFTANDTIDDALRAALRAKSGIPDVAFIGGNLPDYFQVGDQFLDLDDYGFSDHEDEYFDFAIQSAATPEGRQIAAPTDIGPFNFMYNAAEFEKLGLPTDPAEVGAAIQDWDGFRAMAETAKADGKLLCDSPQGIYQEYMAAEGYQYFDVKDGEATLDVESQINKDAFDNAADWAQNGLCGTAYAYSPEWNAGVTQGSIIGMIEPAYVMGILKPAAEASSGDWRIAEGTPGGPAAMSGSFVGAFASTEHPDVAAELVLFFSSEKTQTKAYTTNGLIPSTKASFDDSEVTAPDDFFGGQVAVEPIRAAAENGPFVFRGPNGNAIFNQFRQALDNIAAGADPAAEWKSTVEAAKAG